jgi:hypothetical protein
MILTLASELVSLCYLDHLRGVLLIQGINNNNKGKDDDKGKEETHGINNTLHSQLTLQINILTIYLFFKKVM